MTHTTKEAFIIGNGESRKDFSLDNLRDKITFGCNALYRDWPPSYLVAIDDKIIEEIKNSDFPDDKFIEPPEDEKWEPVEVNPNRPRSNAGIVAMKEAIKMGYENLYCLGFDFLIMDREQSISNLYDGTPCYGMETRARYEDNIGRALFLAHTMLTNPDVTFKFVFEGHPDIIMREDGHIANFSRMTYREFIEFLARSSN